MDLLIIIFLTLLNGIFAMSELAIASSRKARLEAMSAAATKRNNVAARQAKRLAAFRLVSKVVAVPAVGVQTAFLASKLDSHFDYPFLENPIAFELVRNVRVIKPGQTLQIQTFRLSLLCSFHPI